MGQGHDECCSAAYLPLGHFNNKPLNRGIPRQDIELGTELKFHFLFPPANPANLASPTEECGCVRLGKCKWFNVAKGWGFLTPNDGGQEVFVHQVGTLFLGWKWGLSLIQGQPYVLSISRMLTMENRYNNLIFNALIQYNSHYKRMHTERHPDVRFPITGRAGGGGIRVPAHVARIGGHQGVQQAWR